LPYATIFGFDALDPGDSEEPAMTCGTRFLLLALMFGATWATASAETCNPKAVAATTQPTEQLRRPDLQLIRRQQITRRLLTEQFNAIAFGDSIMGAWPTPLLQAALGEPFLNVGFGSDGTEQVLWRLQAYDWSGQHPHYVLLLVGTDDMRFPACAIVQGISTVVRVVHKSFPGAEIIVTSILPRGQDLWAVDSAITSVNRQMAALAATEGFRFFDVHDAFLCDHHTPCVLYKPAGNIHPSEEGYKLLTAALSRFVRGG
jgi:platelet-activating factor acetylhydrolase IB subunit beta/gamma